jgi:hypothetical protein
LTLHFPPMHVVPVQHPGRPAPHICPKRPQLVLPPPSEPLLLPEPPSLGPPEPPSLLPLEPPSPGGGGGKTGVQVPWMDPGGATHGMPVQQSAFVVHVWPLDWHTFGLHVSAPVESGTHGCPQHSVALAHEPFAGTQIRPPSCETLSPRQRGTPSESSWQIVNLGLTDPQQSACALEMEQV